jgi:hypothetical protein
MSPISFSRGRSHGHHTCPQTPFRSPGNNESAGKRQSGRTTKGNQWLRATLVQAAWAASHTKDTYLAAQYRRLAARRGTKRALVAVAHSILVILYYLLKRPTATFRELGPWYLEQLDEKHVRMKACQVVSGLALRPGSRSEIHRLTGAY